MQVRKAIKTAQAIAGVSLSSVALSLGITQQALGNRVSNSSITDQTYDVVEALGYRVVLVPSSSPLPPDSVEVKR